MSAARALGGTISTDDFADFEIFRDRHVPMAVQPFVTILKSGMLSISASAHELLGSPEAVELMYDSGRRTVGLRGVAPTEPHAYPMRAVGARAGAAAYVISGTAFLKFFDIRPDVSRRWVASVVNGVLVVDLSVEGVAVTSNRASKPLRREPKPDK